MERIASRLNIEVSELIRHAEEVSKTSLTIDALKEWLCSSDHENTIILESPDYLSAIIGITEDGRLIYSYDKMVEHLMREDGMEADEAMEFIDYNTVRALPYAGEMAPIIQYNVEI